MEFRLKAHQWFKQTKLFKDLPNATLWLDRFFLTFKVWPLLLLVLIILTHLFVVACISDAQEPSLNRAIGSLLQIVGASVVLWCISQNLALLKGKNILEVIKEEYNDFKRGWSTGRLIIPEVVSETYSSSCSLDAIITEYVKIDTLDDKVEYLMKRSAELEKMIYDTKDSLTKKIENAKLDTKQATKTLNNDVSSLKTTLNNAVLGSIKVEIAGFLMASYGVVISGFFG